MLSGAPARERTRNPAGRRDPIRRLDRRNSLLYNHLRTPKMEAAGIEPSSDLAATGKLPCGCVICEECRAALALQNWRPQWLEVTFDDPDLQRVVESWDALPAAMKAAIMALVRS